MISHRQLVSQVAALVLCGLTAVIACCPVSRIGKPVVNADQTVLILWDAAAKTQHFIRQASFRADAADFGFLVPTPTIPELEESGNEAFDYLRKITEPETLQLSQPSNFGCGCGSAVKSAGAVKSVRVLAEKQVAGFDTVVLEADSAEALVAWLNDHGYEFSPAVQAWAEPYISSGWKMTALKVAKDDEHLAQQTVAASSLRISFQTDRPLFPYREPDPQQDAETLHARHRLLRIYFIADGQYQGELTPETTWTGQVAWADRLAGDQRTKLLDLLKLPGTTGPAEWWLTEFEDIWPYQPAPADLYFAKTEQPQPIHRPPIIEYVSSPWPTDLSAYALAAVFIVWPMSRQFMRRWFERR